MPNVPPDGWESAITTARAEVDRAQERAREADQVAQAARLEVADLLDRLDVGGRGGGAGLPRQLADLAAAVQGLLARVEALEQRLPGATGPDITAG